MERSCAAGLLLWWCCRRRRQQQQTSNSKWQLPKQEAASGSSWTAFVSRPFKKRPPTNLVASKAVDLGPPMEDPEKPLPGSFSSQGLQQNALEGKGPAPMHTYTQPMPLKQQVSPSYCCFCACISPYAVTLVYMQKQSASEHNTNTIMPAKTSTAMCCDNKDACHTPADVL